VYHLGRLPRTMERKPEISQLYIHTDSDSEQPANTTADLLVTTSASIEYNMTPPISSLTSGTDYEKYQPSRRALFYDYAQPPQAYQPENNYWMYQPPTNITSQPWGGFHASTYQEWLQALEDQYRAFGKVRFHNIVGGQCIALQLVNFIIFTTSHW